MEYNFETIKKLISEFEFSEDFDMVVAVANGGIIPAAMINQKLGKEFNIIKISLRDSAQKPMFDEPRLVSQVTFDPFGKSLLLV
ncbi:MAG: phosphoribosyltransferase, partial [Rikenellaceae bacterium]